MVQSQASIVYVFQVIQKTQGLQHFEFNLLKVMGSL